MKNTDDFILAALANVNGKYKGHSIIEYCFKKMNIEQTFHHFSKGDRAIFFEIYQMAIDDGADASVLIRKNAAEFVYLQKATTECFKIINVLLLSEQIKNNLDYKSQFDELLKITTTLVCQINRCNFIVRNIPERYDQTTTMLMVRKDNANRKIDVVCNYEECMRNIYLLKIQPWLINLEVLIKAGADVSDIFNGGVALPFELEHLIEITIDSIQLLNETISGQGAVPEIKKSRVITDEFAGLKVHMDELISILR